MCGSTLIVSPVSIAGQWLAEIDKHIKPGTLKVLVSSAALYNTLIEQSALIYYGLKMMNVVYKVARLVLVDLIHLYTQYTIHATVALQRD